MEELGYLWHSGTKGMHDVNLKNLLCGFLFGMITSYLQVWGYIYSDGAGFS